MLTITAEKVDVYPIYDLKGKNIAQLQPSGKHLLAIDSDLKITKLAFDERTEKLVKVSSCSVADEALKLYQKGSQMLMATDEWMYIGQDMYQ